MSLSILLILEARLILILDEGIPRDYYSMEVTQGQIDEVGTHHLLVNPTAPEIQRQDRANKRRQVRVCTTHCGDSAQLRKTCRSRWMCDGLDQ
jgi:hypothetical protein